MRKSCATKLKEPMLLSHTHQFIFFHIAKTGGSSIRNVLQPYTEEPDVFKIKRPLREQNGQPNQLYEVWQSLLRHAWARDARKQLAPGLFERYYKFAIVRNPWDWHVSMYHFILKEPTHARHTLVQSLGNFENYLAWVINTPTPYPKGAAKAQKEVITDEEGKILVDFIGRYETLAQDFEQICLRIGIVAQLPHINKSTHRNYQTYYNQRTRQLVADHFAADIELFGYRFD